MYWKVFLDQSIGRLELWEGKVIKAERVWTEARNTSQEVLAALQSIREHTGIEWGQVAEFRLDLDLPPHATARRIAETFQNTYNTFVA